MARSFPEAHRLLGVIDPDAAAAVGGRLRELEPIGMGLRPEPLLDGEALIGMGYTPGPLFARVLDGVYDAQLDGRVSDRAGAERLARELADAFGV